MQLKPLKNIDNIYVIYSLQWQYKHLVGLYPLESVYI